MFVTAVCFLFFCGFLYRMTGTNEFRGVKLFGQHNLKGREKETFSSWLLNKVFLFSQTLALVANLFSILSFFCPTDQPTHFYEG